MPIEITPNEIPERCPKLGGCAVLDDARDDLTSIKGDINRLDIGDKIEIDGVHLVRIKDSDDDENNYYTNEHHCDKLNSYCKQLAELDKKSLDGEK